MEMTSLNVSLPKALKDYVESQTAEEGYSTPSEYIRELIRHDRKRLVRERIEEALLEGLSSGPAKEVGSAHWTQKRRALREKHRPTQRIAG